MPKPKTQSKPEAEINRTQGVALWKLAKEYLAGATALQPSPPKISFVVYYLYGHALELTLKAFLVSHGSTISALRGIGHDLKKALLAAEQHQSFQKVVITPEDRFIVEWLSDYYSRKEFEYVFVGYKSLPNPDSVKALCDRVHQNVDGLIRQAVLRHISPTPPTP